jgi:hypothetical protein
MATRTVRCALLRVVDSVGRTKTYTRGDVVTVPDDHPRLAEWDREGHVTTEDLETPEPERAVRISDANTGIPNGPIIGVPASSGNRDDALRLAALQKAAAASVGAPMAGGLAVIDDIEDVDAPGADTGLDTVDPNEGRPAAPPSPPADPFAGMVAPSAQAGAAAEPLAKPVRAASKAAWAEWVASLPADQRDGLTAAEIDESMSKMDIVHRWG